jgi:hypothetical protein
MILYYFYAYISDFVFFFCLNGCVGWYLCSRLWAWNGLPLKTYIAMYARTNRCCNERGSRTNYVRSSTTPIVPYAPAENRIRIPS